MEFFILLAIIYMIIILDNLTKNIILLENDIDRLTRELHDIQKDIG